MKKYLFLTSFIALCLALPTFAANKTTTIKKQISQTYHQWCHAIGAAKGDPKEVVRFYAPDAILVPTLSHKILVNKNGGLDDYFTKLTSYPHIKCEPEEEHIRIHNGTVINSGLYEFSYINQEGKKVEIPSRFTFVYKKYGHNWMIVNHHSSKMPG